MDKVKVSLEAIRANYKLSRKDMSDVLGCSEDRYQRLATRKARLYASELANIHEKLGVPYENIDYSIE